MFTVGLRVAAVAFLSLVVLAGAPAAQTAPFAALRALGADALKKLGAPGLSVAVAVNNRLAWAEGFGLADVEQEVPVRPDTVFRIASISKPITAVAVMQLVERGRVSLDDPVQRYVPAFPQKGEQVVTIRHLLTHTSGIRHYRGDEFNSTVSYDTVEAALSIFKDDPLLFPPGARYSYSTYGYNLLGGVVERASGLAFEVYLQERIWKPAGMTATALERPGDVVRFRARQYVRSPSGLHNAPYADLSVKWAGGGMISTATDLIRFHVALEEGRLLKPETLARMYTPFTLNDGRKSSYGLGWELPVDEKGRPWIAHSGGATGGTTYLLRDPARRLAVAILANVQNAPGLRQIAIGLADAAIATTGAK
ncbi:MAG: serine hydrolase domain-containing protein [Acidobacteriota bacterium]